MSSRRELFYLNVIRSFLLSGMKNKIKRSLGNAMACYINCYRKQWSLAYCNQQNSVSAGTALFNLNMIWVVGSSGCLLFCSSSLYMINKNVCFTIHAMNHIRNWHCHQLLWVWYKSSRSNYSRVRTIWIVGCKSKAGHGQSETSNYWQHRRFLNSTL